MSLHVVLTCFKCTYVMPSNCTEPCCTMLTKLCNLCSFVASKVFEQATILQDLTDVFIPMCMTRKEKRVKEPH